MNKENCALVGVLGTAMLSIVLTCGMTAHAAVDIKENGTSIITTAKIVPLGANVSLTAVCSDHDGDGPLVWTSTWEFLDNSTQGRCNQHSITSTGVANTAGTWTITASCPDHAPTGVTGTLKIEEVSSLTIAGATEWATDIYATPQQAGQNVTITAVLNPTASAGDLPANFVTWSGGIAGADQLQRVVSRTTPTDVTVTATCGTSSQSVRIVVRRVDGANAVVTPTSSPTINNPGPANNCTPDDPDDHVVWHTTYNSADDNWYVRVDSLTLTGTININPWPSQPSSMVVPNTANPVDGGNINNVVGSNNRWSYAQSDMGDYDSPGAGRGPHWHSTSASSAHEMYHWNTEWMNISMGPTGGDWADTESDLELLTVSGASNLTEANAIASLTSAVNTRLATFRSAAWTCWAALPGEPGTGAGAYAAGMAVLNGLITNIETYRLSKSW